MAKELSENIKLRNGKIIVVSSIAYKYSSIDPNDVDFSSKKKHSLVYGNAKRFLTFSLMELAKKEQIDLSIVHPGITLTEMTNHYHKSINWFVKLAIKLFFHSNEKACLSLIKGLTENTKYLEWIGPKIFNVWGKPKKQQIKKINQNEIDIIFKIAEKIYENI